jgi:hypothetical protein
MEQLQRLTTGDSLVSMQRTRLCSKHRTSFALPAAAKSAELADTVIFFLIIGSMLTHSAMML